MFTKHFRLPLSACVAAQLLAAGAQAAPVNDKQTGALDLPSANFSFLGTVSGATPEPSIPLAGRKDMRTVWYRIKNLPVGRYFIDPVGSASPSAVAIGVWMDPDGSGEWIKIGENSAVPIVGTSSKLSGLLFKNTAKPTDFYIEVARAPEDTVSDFRLNIQTVAGGKIIVVTPPTAGFFGMGKFDGALSFGSNIIDGTGVYALNIAPKAATFSAGMTGLSEDDVIAPSASGPVASGSAVRLTFKSKGLGPHIGEVGTFRHTVSFQFISDSQVGAETRTLTLLRSAPKQSGKPLTTDAVPNSAAGKLGESVSSILTISNPAGAAATGCTLWNLPGLALSGLTVDFLKGYSYQQIDPVTHAAIGGKNPIFSLAAGASKTFKLGGTIRRASDAALDVFEPACADSAGVAETVMADSALFTYARDPKGTVDAFVSYPAVKAPRLVKLAKGGTKLVKFVVDNAGPLRKVTIFAHDGVFASSGSFPTTASICAASGSACSGSPVSSLSVTLPAMGAKTFYVQLKNNGTAVPFDAVKGQINVVVKEGNYIAGSAGFVTQTP